MSDFEEFYEAEETHEDTHGELQFGYTHGLSTNGVPTNGLYTKNDVYGDIEEHDYIEKIMDIKFEICDIPDFSYLEWITTSDFIYSILKFKPSGKIYNKESNLNPYTTSIYRDIIFYTCHTGLFTDLDIYNLHNKLRKNNKFLFITNGRD